MAESPSIEQIVAQIRTAVYGKDVRENIALGIEKCYQQEEPSIDKEIHYGGVGGYYPIDNAEFMDTRNEFKSNSMIKTVVIKNDSVSNLHNLSISFWRIIDDRVVRYKTLSLSGTQSGMDITFNVNENLPYNTYVSYADPDILSTPISVHGLLAISSGANDFAKSYLNTGINYQLVMDIYYTERPSKDSGIVVNVGEGLDYEEIQDALESTGNADLTIILHPRSYPYKRFSMMRSLSQGYPWQGLANVRNISIIGIDKYKCIIQDDSGNYNSPPAEIACNGVIKNITFISTHNSATWVSGDAPSYAVHVDNRPADVNGMKLTFEDCIFTSYQSSAVGVGVYRNQTICFRDCEFYNKTPNNYSPYSGYDASLYNNLGAIIMHTSMAKAKGNDYFKLINNLFITDNNRYAMVLRETEASPTCTLVMIGNTLWNSARGDAEIKWEGSGTFIQAPYNRLNNNNSVNA